MNFGRRLKRVSAAFWGLVGLFGALLLSAQSADRNWPMFFSVLGVAFALHRVTCWIVNGFSRA